jgi:ankyrin repeat protein
MMSRDLPARPSLEHLKKQARELLKSGAAGPLLADAQHALAREYGFASWPKLKAHVDALAVDADPGELLCAAIRARDAFKVQRILDRHPDLARRLDEPIKGGYFGATALLTAVESGSLEVIDILLRAGADIDARSHWWAGSFGVLDNDGPLGSFLIERGATVDAYAAARLGMMDRLAGLIAADPGLVHLRGGDGQTPLHVARSVEIARFLLGRGADIDAVDVDHESTPAQYLVRDRPDVARFLVASGCHTDLLMAAALGDLALVRRHLDAEPDSIRMVVSEEFFPKRNPRAGGTIYIWTLGGYKTPHAVARDFGHQDIYRLLMERSPGELQLAEAAERGDDAQVGELVRRDPDLARALTGSDRRRLAHAACSNNTDAVRLMLAAGWPVDVRGQEDGTPLHWAAFHGNVAMVLELLRHRAPVDVRGDKYDAPPIGWAVYGSLNAGDKQRGDHAAVVQALLEAGASAPAFTEDLEASAPVREVLRRHAGRGGAAG